MFGIFFALPKRLYRIRYGHIKDNIRPPRARPMQYSLGVRLPSLQPYTRAIHLALGYDIGIIGCRSPMVATPSLMGEG